MQALSKHKLNFLFSFSFFLIQIVSSTFLSVITLITISLGWIQNPDPLFMLVIFVIMSIFSGTLLTKLVGKHVLKPIIQLNEAAHAVSQGNFNIQLEEKAFGKEIRELIRSFNIMTKELSHIETFRNDLLPMFPMSLKHLWLSLKDTSPFCRMKPFPNRNVKTIST